MSSALEQVAVDLIRAAATVAPSVGVWLAELVSGRTDAMSKRVEAILPATSKSERALNELRRKNQDR